MVISEQVAEIRFPEFSCSLKEYNFEHLYEFKSTNSFSRDLLNYQGGEVKNIHYGDIHKSFSSLFDIKNEIAPYINADVNLTRVKKEQFINNGDLVIADASEDYKDIGKTIEVVSVAGEKIVAGLHTFLARRTTDFNYIGYMTYFLQTWFVRKQIMRIAQGTKVLSLSTSRVAKLKIILPCIDEQQKIADFLSSFDKKIALLKEKHDLLAQYKKGVMQKLFSQEIRFKDEAGNDFPDWEEKALSQVLEIQVREISKPTEKYLALGIRSHMKGTFQKPNFDPESIMMEKLFIVRPNDLIINITFAWEGAVAIAKKEDDGGLVSHRFPTYTFKDGESTHKYFKHIITLKRFKYMLDLISPGGAGRNRVLSKKEFLKLKWNLPSVEEQLKIADFLDVLDNKIELVAQQIEHTQTFKKGLLQQMFV